MGEWEGSCPCIAGLAGEVPIRKLRPDEHRYIDCADTIDIDICVCWALSSGTWPSFLLVSKHLCKKAVLYAGIHAPCGESGRGEGKTKHLGKTEAPIMHQHHRDHIDQLRSGLDVFVVNVHGMPHMVPMMNVGCGVGYSVGCGVVGWLVVVLGGCGVGRVVACGVGWLWC